MPGGVDPLSDSNVEMDWTTFAGEYSEIYEAIIRQRCINDGLGDDEKTLAKYFRLHLNRGINHYSTRDVLKTAPIYSNLLSPKRTRQRFLLMFGNIQKPVNTGETIAQK